MKRKLAAILCAEEILRLSIYREEVIGRDYGIPVQARERMK